jgi:hypothetical protein
MRLRIQVVCLDDDGAEQMQQVLEFEREDLVMATLRMSISEGKYC